MKKKSSLYTIAIQRSSVWKGEPGLAYNSFYLPSIGLQNSSNNSDSARMLQHPKASRQCHLAKNGDYQGSPYKCCLWYRLVWQIRSGPLSRISRTYPFAIPNGPSPLQPHHGEADALNAGLYTIGMRLHGKCPGTRLRKVFMGSHDRTLDYWNMRTSALV
jgi:hypothetical protein